MPQNTVNLAEKLDLDTAQQIGRELVHDYESDREGRQPWAEKRDRWYKLWAGERDAKTSPWVGCSNVSVPLVLTACNQFHGRAYSAIFAAPGMVRALPVEPNDVARAKNVEAYMNWQTLYEMEEYEDEFDKMLIDLPINGTTFKKTYYDAIKKRNVSEYVSAVDVVLPYRTKSLDEARRISHVIWLHYDQLQQRDRNGLYAHFDAVRPESATKDEQPIRHTADAITGEADHRQDDSPKCLIEVHRDLQLDWDDAPQPYVLTVDVDTATVLRITERTVKLGGKRSVLNYFTDYHFFPNPQGFYSFGFGHFLENLNEMANTTFNQIFDAGRLTNTPFGFYGRRAGFKKRQISLSPGMMNEVDDVSQVHFPSMQRLDQVLFMVLGQIQTYSEQISSNSDYLMGREAKGTKTPTATGTTAIIEQGLVTFGTLTKRIFRSLRKELRLLFALNSLFLPDEKQYRILGDTKSLPFAKIGRNEFDGRYDIIPIGDPSFASKTTRRQEAMERYQILMTNPLIGPNPATGEIAHPQGVLQALSDVLDAYDTKNKSALMPELPEPMKGPEQENAMFMQGDTRDPQLGEDHAAHLQTHITFIDTEFFATMRDDYKTLLVDHIQKTRAMQYEEAAARQQLGQQQPMMAEAQNPMGMGMNNGG